MPSFHPIDKKQEFINDGWTPVQLNDKFDSKNRIVDGKGNKIVTGTDPSGRKYKIIEKLNKKYSKVELIRRRLCGGFLVVISFGFGLRSKTVKNLLHKKVKSVRFAEEVQSQDKKTGYGGNSAKTKSSNQSPQGSNKNKSSSTTPPSNQGQKVTNSSSQINPVKNQLEVYLDVENMTIRKDELDKILEKGDFATQYPNLKVATFSGKGINELPSLPKNLEGLTICHCQIDNLKEVRNLTNLNELNIYGTGIINLENLPISLQTLRLYSCEKLKDIKEINKMNIKWVYFKGLPLLTDLKLENSSIMSITIESCVAIKGPFVISGLKKLNFLKIIKTPISQIEPLKKKPSLIGLKIIDCEPFVLESLTSIIDKNFTELTYRQSKNSKDNSELDLKGLEELKLISTEAIKNRITPPENNFEFVNIDDSEE